MSVLERIITAGALLGLAVLAVAVLAVIMGRRNVDNRLVGLGRRFGLPAAFGVAVLSVLGSLYFSQVALYEPCNLCWWQRVFMFPLVVILGIAWWKNDGGVKKYAIPLATIGALFAAYNAYVQQWPPASQHCAFGGLVDCSSRYVFTLGFITIPLMSLVAFLSVIACLALWRPKSAPDSI